MFMVILCLFGDVLSLWGCFISSFGHLSNVSSHFVCRFSCFLFL